MTDIRSDIGLAADDEDVGLAERLARERRQPPAAFRVGLRNTFAGRVPRPRPENLRRLIASYAGAGALLLALGALGAAGVGPFAV